MPHVRREFTRFVNVFATTLRKSLQVGVLVALGYLTAWAFDLPREEEVETWFKRAAAIVILTAVLYDMILVYRAGEP